MENGEKEYLGKKKNNREAYVLGGGFIFLGIISGIAAIWVGIFKKSYTDLFVPFLAMLQFIIFGLVSIFYLGYAKEGIGINNTYLKRFRVTKTKRIELGKISWDNIKEIYLMEQFWGGGGPVVIIEGIWEKPGKSFSTKSSFNYISNRDFYGIFNKVIAEICKRAKNAIIDEKVLKIAGIEKPEVAEKMQEIEPGISQKLPVDPKNILYFSIIFTFITSGIITAYQYYKFKENNIGKKLILATVLMTIGFGIFLYSSYLSFHTKKEIWPENLFWYIVVVNIFLGQYFAYYQRKLYMKFKYGTKNEK